MFSGSGDGVNTDLDKIPEAERKKLADLWDRIKETHGEGPEAWLEFFRQSAFSPWRKVWRKTG